MQEAWSSLFLICAVQWRSISDDWLLDYLEEHEDRFSEREVYLLRELADLLADLDQLDLDKKEMSCLLFIALFNPCRFLFTRLLFIFNEKVKKKYPYLFFNHFWCLPFLIKFLIFRFNLFVHN